MRATLYEAAHTLLTHTQRWCRLKAWGVWQHRLTRIRERCTDLFGRISWRWRVIRTSNAYVFRDPKCADCRQIAFAPAAEM